MATKTAPVRHGLRVRKLAGPDHPGAVKLPDHKTGELAKYPLAGVAFLDAQLRRTDEVPKHLRIPHDYVEREPWIEMVNPRGQLRAKGPAEDPFRQVHQFVHCDELVLHMKSGDHRYRVVGQPDKYGPDGTAGDFAGNPDADVRWFFDADLVEG